MGPGDLLKDLMGLMVRMGDVKIPLSLLPLTVQRGRRGAGI